MLGRVNRFVPKVKQQMDDRICLFKTKPTFIVDNVREFEPSAPCGCLSFAKCSDKPQEKVGIRDLFKLEHSKINCQLLMFILKQHLRSILVHWNQLEFLRDLKGPKVFVTSCQSPINLWVLAYIVNYMEEMPVLLNNHSIYSTSEMLPYFISAKNDDKMISKILIINSEDSDDILEEFKTQLGENISFIPVSICQEFPAKKIQSSLLDYIVNLVSKKELGPQIRVNFGLPYFLDDCFDEEDFNGKSLKEHILYDIWRNTPIMSFHVVSMLKSYYNNKEDPVELASRMQEFIQQFSGRHDMTVGRDVQLLTRYGCDLLALRGPVERSMAVDVLLTESMMMKAVLSCVDSSQVDVHAKTLQVKQSQVLANFETMHKILRREVRYVHPPCLSENTVTNNALDVLLTSCIVSMQSAQTSNDDEIRAKKIAYNLDIDFMDDDDDDVAPVEVQLYVDVKNLSSRRWVADIADSLLQIYYASAKYLLSVDDVVEDAVFVDRVLRYAADLKPHSSEVRLRETIFNTLDLFSDLDIIRMYRHSGIRVFDIEYPTDEEKMLKLVAEIAHFVD